MQNKSQISIIVAIDRNNAIGNKNGLLFHISDDLRRFKRLTTGNTVIMGRRTFESLPKGALPNRRNVVVSRTAGFTAPGAEVAPSLEEALSIAAGDPRIFIIGGGSVYEAALPLADVLEITQIDATAKEADTYFPMIDPELWETTEATQWNTGHDPGYRFVTMHRKK